MGMEIIYIYKNVSLFICTSYTYTYSVGMGAAKYTAHEDMKTLLRTYFPKRKQDDKKEEEEGEGEGRNDVEEDEAPPAYTNNGDTANPTDDGDGNAEKNYED